MSMARVYRYKPRSHDPTVLLLVITAIFAIYGPTFDALCATGLAGFLMWTAALLASLFFVFSGWRLANVALSRYKKYLQRPNETPPGKIRAWIVKVFILLVVTVLAGAPVYLTFMGLFETMKINLEDHLPAGLLYFSILGIEPLSGLNIKASSAQASISSLGFCGNSGFHWSAIAQLLLAIISVALAIRAGRQNRKNPKIPVWFPLVLSTGILVSIFAIAPAGLATREADYLPYLNIYAIAFVAMSLLLLIPRFLLPPIISNFEKYHPKKLGHRLRTTELFQGKPQTPPLSWTRILYGLMISPFLHLLHLLLLPGFVALTFPTDIFKFWVYVALGFSWLLIAWGGMYWRWNQMIFLATRYFFRGLPLVVSILIIGLGAARYFDVHYIANLLDMTRFGALTMLVVMLYSLSWLFDHFFNREITERLLHYLGAHEGEDWLVYPYQGPALTDVPNENRWVQRHGADRIAVVGVLEQQNEPVQIYHIWELLAFFRKLSGDDGSSPDTQENTADIEAFRSLRRRVLFYRSVMYVSLIVLLAFMLIVTDMRNGDYSSLKPVASADETRQETKAPFSLASRLRQQAANGQPAILVAASGGGTRAALYAYSVLRGIAEVGQIENVVLTSGVSGGGTSLAYFASHHRELTASPVNDKAWLAYREKMASPFVNDVLEGILEPRVYRDTRLGILLEESFARHFGQSSNQSDSNSLYSADMGVIFNTSITAHPCLSTHLTTRLFAECDDETTLAYNTLAGGRLIFTNLQETAAFDQVPRLKGQAPHEGHDQTEGLYEHIAPDVYLPYRIIDDERIRLTTAAALNANFPPVFFDAPVEIRTAEGTERFYVTDGGATDNRGLISMLTVLRHTLDRLDDGEIPEIHIVMAEASATGNDYESELGLGTATSSAKAIIASGLINELLGDIRQIEANIHVTYLNMPAALRSRGGLGTHWMMPGTVKLTSPYTLVPDPDTRQTIDARDFKCTMDILYGSYSKLDDECKGFLERFASEPGAGTDAEMIKKQLWLITGNAQEGYKSADYHLEAWNAFREHFANRTSAP